MKKLPFPQKTRLNHNLMGNRSVRSKKFTNKMFREMLNSLCEEKKIKKVSAVTDLQRLRTLMS